MSASQLMVVRFGSSSTTIDRNVAQDAPGTYDHLFPGFDADVKRHHNMLANTTTGFQTARPILFVKTRPATSRNPGNSGSNYGATSLAVRRRYEQLAHQLDDLESREEDTIESGAVRTAAIVIDQLSKREIAPPELSWIGGEAIVMLWMLGSTKYALTVTDGEIGYVVRAEGKTLRRSHGIPAENLDVLQLT